MSRGFKGLPEPDLLPYTRGDHKILAYRWAHQAAPRFVLVHGIGMGAVTFARFIDAILPDAEVLAVDLPGFGDSPEPERALSIPDTADLLAEALRAANASTNRNDPVIAVGHSMGSQVVAELAARHPELVDRVILFAPAVNAAERTVKQQAKRMMQDLFAGKPLIAMATGVVEYAKAGPRWFVKKLEPTMEHRIEDCLPQVAQPTLVLCGSKDRVTPPEWCYQVALALPDGELTVLGGPGHEAMIAEGSAAAERVWHWLES